LIADEHNRAEYPELNACVACFLYVRVGEVQEMRFHYSWLAGATTSGRPPGRPHIDTRLASAYPENRMEVHLTPDQKAFVRQAIESGRLNREEDAVQEALSLWEERERTRAEILTALDVAEASIARGEGRTITQESMRQLADEVKQRGRRRLAAEESSPR